MKKQQAQIVIPQVRFRYVWWIRLCVFLVFTVGLWMGLRYFLGETTIIATLDGEPLEGATVEIDGKVVGKTPFTTRLSPGSYSFRVLPPEEGLCEETEWAGFMWTIIRGMDFDVSFHTRVASTNTNQAEARECHADSDCEVGFKCFQDKCVLPCGHCSPWQHCDEAEEICVGPTTCADYAPEVCDGVDNDCDGQTDEGCTAEPRCTAGETLGCNTGMGGACSHGLRTCYDDESDFGPCVPLSFSDPEVCGNHRDDNCDGQTDEDCP